MKTITKSYEVYDLAELSDNAKMRAMDAVLDQCRPDFVFDEDIDYLLEMRYPQSDLKAQYSFSCSQGDGVNLYGNVDLRDFFDAWSASCDCSILATRKVYNLLENYGFEYEISENPRYTYSYKRHDRANVEGEAEYRYDYIKAQNGLDGDKVNRAMTIRALADLLNFTLKSLEDFEDDIGRQGEAWFFNITEEEAEEEAEANGHAFTVDGELFNID